MKQALGKAALVGGVILVGIIGSRSCQQQARLNRPVQTKDIPAGYDYLMRTDSGSDFYTKLKSSNIAVRKVLAHRIDARGQVTTDLSFSVDCQGNQLQVTVNGSGWFPIEPNTVGEQLYKRYC